MMQIFRKKDGAVTVFLTIILVPIIVISCLFVDASRIRLAQSVVSSAGDLTLNTVLTQYDPILNDYYGMLASCQDIDDFLEKADEYFMACVTSQGVEHSDARKYVDQINGMINGNGGEIVDLLQISEAGGGKFTVMPVENGALDNPALVKKEIVEFMKYRAPIDAVMEILEKFQNSAKDLEGAKDDADLTEKKQDYYEAEGAVCEQAWLVYKALKEYENLAITSETIDEMKEKIKDTETEYRGFHKKMVKDLYNTAGRPQFTWDEYKVLNFQLEDGAVRKNQVNDYIKKLAEYIHRFSLAAERLESVRGMLPENDPSQVYDIQLWREWDDILNQNKSTCDEYVNMANDMVQHMALLSGAMEELSEAEKNEIYELDYYEYSPTSGTKTRQGHYDELKRRYDELRIQYVVNTDSAYNYMKETWEGLSKPKNEGRTNPGDTDAGIKKIYNDFIEYYDKYHKASEALQSAIDGLDTLVTLLSEYDSSLESWKNKAEKYDTSLAKSDREYIAKDVEKDTRENVTEQTIAELRQRLVNIKNLMESLKAALDEYRYNGTCVRAIDKYETFKACSGVDASQITYMDDPLESYAVSSFKFSSSTTLGSIQVTEQNQPKLDVQTPKLYQWMKEKFKNADDSEINSAKKSKDDEAGKYTVDSKNVGKGNQNSKNEITTSSNLPSKSRRGSGGSGGGDIETKLEDASKKTSKLFTGFGDTVKRGAVALRDDLYALDYIMNMFSYDTYEYEGKYHLCEGKVTAQNYPEKYKSVSDQWKSMEKKDTYNKTLTNKMISTANNYSYGNEVEYILYGDTNEKNKKAAYGTIFAIRYVLNLCPEFQRCWTLNQYPESQALETAALGVQAASFGIIPKSLFKLVVILGLTAMEAARDVENLKKGLPVELIKSADDLECVFSETKPVIEECDNNPSESAWFYSDYITVLLFLKLMTEEYTVYARVADVIQVNMNHILEKEETPFAMNKSVVYFQGKVTVKILPLMLDLPIVTNNGTDAPEGEWNQIHYESIRGY